MQPADLDPRPTWQGGEINIFALVPISDFLETFCFKKFLPIVVNIGAIYLGAVFGAEYSIDARIVCFC